MKYPCALLNLKKCKSPGANWWQRFPWYFHDFVANHVSATTMCIHRKETWKDVMRRSQSSYQSVRVHHGCPLRTAQLGNFREAVADWSLNQVRRKQFEIVSTRFLSNKPCYVLLRTENTLGKTSSTSFLRSLVTYRTYRLPENNHWIHHDPHLQIPQLTLEMRLAQASRAGDGGATVSMFSKSQCLKRWWSTPQKKCCA